jgi:hypothetical protein
MFGPPKTSSGEARRVDLGRAGVGVVLGQKCAQDAERAQWATAYEDHDLVFAQQNGDPIHPERVTKRFTQLVRSSGLRRTRLHDLRHARASLLLASGTDIAVVSKMLGHSSITLTADTYSHLLEGVGRQAADAADALIPRVPRDQSVTTLGIDGTSARSDVKGAGPVTWEDAGAPSGTRTPNPLIKSPERCVAYRRHESA